MQRGKYPLRSDATTVLDSISLQLALVLPSSGSEDPVNIQRITGDNRRPQCVTVLKQSV